MTIATKTVELGNLALDIPADWTYGRMSDGRWWCGDMEKTATAYLGLEMFDIPADAAAATPTANVDGYVAEIVGFLRSMGFSNDIAIDPVPSGRIVRAVADYRDYGHAYRDYRWYMHNGRNDYVSRLRVSLVVQLDAWEDRRLEPLVDLFRAFAVTYDSARTHVDGTYAPSLKEHAVDGLFSLNIPERWRWFDEDGVRFFRDATGAPVTFAMKYDLFGLKPELAGGRIPDLARRMAESRFKRPRRADETVIDEAILDTPIGALTRYVDDVHDNSEEIGEQRECNWVYVIAGQRDLLDIYLHLSISSCGLARPALAELPAIMEREILALRLGERFDR